MNETLRRALRTFVEAAAGYVAAHAAVISSGAAEGSAALRGALVMIITAGVACGIAAVMNLPEKKISDEEKEPAAPEGEAAGGEGKDDDDGEG